MSRPSRSQAERKLDARRTQLQAEGADDLRLEVLDRARRFKRTWIELAEALKKVRDRHAYERWGYPDLHSYASHELQIKAATVDKLMLSFHTLERHAPQVLQRDGIREPIPSQQAVSYFANVLEREPANASAEVDTEERAQALQELRSAVFDDPQPVTELRRRFDPVLRPKPEHVQEQQLLRKLGAAADKVSELMSQVDGLSPSRVRRVEAALDALREDLGKLAHDAQARGGTSQGRASPGGKLGNSDSP